MCPGKAADLSSQLETLVKVLTYSIRYNGPLLDPEAPNPSHEVDPSEGRGLGFRPRHSALHPSMFDSCHSMLDEFKVSHCSPSFMPPDCYVKCPFLSLKVLLRGFLGVLRGLHELSHSVAGSDVSASLSKSASRSPWNVMALNAGVPTARS